MEKIVKDGMRNTHIVLDGEETAVVFDKPYRVFVIRNIGSTTAYASLDKGIEPLADGTYTVNAGDTVTIAFVRQTNKVYLKGTGAELEVFAANIAYPVYSTGTTVVSDGTIESAEEMSTEEVDNLFK